MNEPIIKETQLNRIMRRTGRKVCECKCERCKSQCKTPCLGTPQDIERLIDAGYADRLQPTLWMAGIILGVVSSPIAIVTSRTNKDGCVFFHDGLCELHDKGLKPTEGRLSHHSMKLSDFKASKSISWNVAREWVMEENSDVIERIIKKLKYNV